MPDNVIPDNMNNKKKVQFTPLSFKYGQTSNKTSTLFFFSDLFLQLYELVHSTHNKIWHFRFILWVFHHYFSYNLLSYLFIYSNFSLSLSFVYCVWKQNRIPYFETTQLRVCLVPLFGILKENIFIFKVLNID